MTEGSNEAAQPGRFSLKEVESDSNVNDLTTKRHDRERRNVLMTLVGLRKTRGRGNAVSTGSEGQLAAVVNAVENTTWLKPNVGTNLANPSGFQLEALESGRWAQRGGEKHVSIAPDERRSGDTPNWMLVISELQFGWRRGGHNDGRTEDAKDTSKYNELGLQAVHGCRLGSKRSRIQRTMTTGLISCHAGELCLDSLHAGNERQRWRTEMETLQTSSPRRVLMCNYICGNSFNLTQYRKESVWLHQWTRRRTARRILWLNPGQCGSLLLWAISLWVVTCIATWVERVVGQASR